MKADLASLGAARAERGQRTPSAQRHGPAGWAEKSMTLLAGAGLMLVACGIVAAVLWLAWQLADILP